MNNWALSLQPNLDGVNAVKYGSSDYLISKYIDCFLTD